MFSSSLLPSLCCALFLLDTLLLVEHSFETRDKRPRAAIFLLTLAFTRMRSISAAYIISELDDSYEKTRIDTTTTVAGPSLKT